MHDSLRWLVLAGSISIGATSMACGGAIASSSSDNATESSAQGVYTLQSATIDEDPTTSAFGSSIVPLFLSLCPGTSEQDFSVMTNVSDTGVGSLVLGTPCATYHVPVVNASIDDEMDGTSSFTALVPSEQLVRAIHADLAQSASTTCDDPDYAALDAPIRKASNATMSLNGEPNVAAIGLRVVFATRAQAAAPPAATVTCP
jgi:hypothetical protein